MSDEKNATPDPAPKICPNCAGINTVKIITKSFGSVVRYYYQCSECNYLWPAKFS